MKKKLSTRKTVYEGGMIAKWPKHLKFQQKSVMISQRLGKKKFSPKSYPQPGGLFALPGMFFSAH